MTTKEEVASYLGSIIGKPFCKSNECYQEDTVLHPVESIVSALKHKYSFCKVSECYINSDSHMQSIIFSNSTLIIVDSVGILAIDICDQNLEYLYTEIYITDRSAEECFV